MSHLAATCNPPSSFWKFSRNTMFKQKRRLFMHFILYIMQLFKHINMNE